MGEAATETLSRGGATPILKTFHNMSRGEMRKKYIKEKTTT